MIVFAKPLVAALMALVGATQAGAGLTPAQVQFWQRIAHCETGSRWDWGAHRRPGEGPVYEGGVGFYRGSWRWWAGELGLLRRWPHAYMAPARVQMAVAQYGLERYRGYWGCLHDR